MATYYSSLYTTNTIRNTTAGVESTSLTRLYRGPVATGAGSAITFYAEFVNSATTQFTVSTSDQLIILPMPQGGRLVDFQWATSGDLDTDNDFTLNLGYTGALTAYLSANTGLQATVATLTRPSLTLTGLTGGGPTNNTSDLILSAQAGELEAAGTLVLVGTIVVPY